MRYLVTLIIFCSCYSQKKAGKQIDKALSNFPTVVAERCAKNFPCSSKTDTLISYDLIKVPCPPDTITEIIINEKEGKTDTVILIREGEVKTVELPAKVVTVTIKDSAQIIAIRAGAEKEIAAANKRADKNKTWKQFFLGGMVISILLLALAIYLLIRGLKK